MKVQTAEEDSVRLVCYSPEKRTNFHQSQVKQLPVRITNAKKSPNKRLTTKEEYTITKRARVFPTTLDFSFNETLSNRFHTVDDALKEDLYETVDLKVKVLSKCEDKETVFLGETPRCKTDAIVADETNSVKLVLWEDTIDKIIVGKSYQIDNCKVRIFEDKKYINTNELTKITEVEDIKDVNLASPEVQENLAIGKCIGVDIKKNNSCIMCNKKLADLQLTQETITCPNCHLTMLSTMTKKKMVCQLVLEIEGKLYNYTTFNDAIQSFLRNIKCDTPATELDPKELTMKLLNAGKQKLLVDKTARIVSNFLPSK